MYVQVLNESKRKLAIFYSVFYKESPDFSREDDQIKAMAMVYVLWEHSVYLPIPISFKLSMNNLGGSKVWSENVESLYNLEQESNQNNVEEQESWSIPFARLLGEMVYCYSPRDAMPFMEELATILFLTNHSSVKTIHDIESSPYVNCDCDEISIIMELIESLDTLRNYVCGIGTYGKEHGVLKDLDKQKDNIFETVDLILKKNKKKN